MRKILRLAKDRPCADCGGKLPYYVMDLDHRNDADKRGNFGQLICQGVFSEEKLLAEIAKCDVICANCHRERTHRRKQYLVKQWR